LFDLIIRGAEVNDGTGSPRFKGDVGIRAGRIASVGNLAGQDAASEIDARGLTLTPGFIDVHGHGDTGILVNPQAECKIRQGITTQVVGQCGSSPFPLRNQRREDVRRNLARYGLELTWETAGEYFKTVEQARPAINSAFFVGQGAIRESVMGDKDLPPDPAQMREMKDEVARAMDAGAIGLTTGLIYTPGSFADTAELTELTKTAAEMGGMYASHIRGEGDPLLEAVDEALTIGKNAGCPVQISHLKASAPRNWGKVKTAIEIIEAAEARGQDVAFDKYPYTAGSTSLSTYLPRWAVGDGIERLMEHLESPEMRKRIFAEANDLNDGDKKWDSVVIIGAESKEFAPYEGLTVYEISRKTGRSLEDVFCDLLLKSRAEADIVCFTQSQEDTDMAILHRLGLVCTDSGVWAPYGPLARIKPHPRAYGTFPLFLKRYVKELKALTPEEAVRKITLQSAERFGLKDRGSVRPGYFADLVLLDWERLRDKATYQDPHQYPEGVEGVVVNGVLTLWKGEHTGERAGKVLRRQ